VRSAIVLAVLLTSGAANAMGSDRLVDLVAWNSDGSAALLRSTSFRDGDTGLSYAIIAADGPATNAVVSATTRDSGKDLEQIDTGSCRRAVRELATAIAARHFDNVLVRADDCAGNRTAIATIDATGRGDVERSWVAMPQGRAATAREQAVWAAVRTFKPGYAPVLPIANPNACATSYDTLDAATRSGKLLLVFTSWTCNSPIRVTVTAFKPGANGYVDLKLEG
jgi:hypothetical protein